jgi:UDP-sulfoquinovose synthase
MEVADDQQGRSCDVAAQFSGDDEDILSVLHAWLDAHDYSRAVGGLEGGVRHLNMWKGTHDKSQTALTLLAKLGCDAAEAVYVGDSPNDRCCFKTFAKSYGVAGVRAFPGLADDCGTVTAGEASDGFLEAAADAFPRHAFATLVTNDFYVTGAVALAKSLAATGTKAPLICLVGTAVTSTAALEAVGVTVQRVESLDLSAEFIERHALDNIKAAAPYNSAAVGGDKPRLFKNMDNFMKLRLWQQTNLAKVVYLDADTVVVQNIDELFEHEGEFTVSHNFHVRASQLNKINSGVFVLKPSLATFAQMEEVLATSQKLYTRTDQTFLEDFFEGRTHALDFKYNSLQYTYLTHPEVWDWSRVKVVHYIMQKPWDLEGAAASPPRAELQPLRDLWWTAYNMPAADGSAAVAPLLEQKASTGGVDAAALELKVDSAEAKVDGADAEAEGAGEAKASDAATEQALVTAGLGVQQAVAKGGARKRVIVVGGDGFCGWPLALRLNKAGHEVMIVDNLSRRRIDTELGVESLTPIATIMERLEAWKETTGLTIDFENINVATQVDRFQACVRKYAPTTIVHFGEQRAAPYSMKNLDTRMYTVNNNINATHSILNAIVEVDQTIHLVHLGTMGVYGYGTVQDCIIPEGYVNVQMKNSAGEWRETEIRHPGYPGSVYHTTKVIDADLMAFYAKNYQLSVTDLHQGIVWGLETDETRLHPKLVNRIDYDSDYGTVLNRWIIQSACEVPLTVYGTGQQTRAFIHIQNSVQCVDLAIMSPPLRTDKKVKIFNQMTECHRIIELAKLLQRVIPGTQVQFIENPRKELESNDLVVKNENFLALGLKPIFLSDEATMEVYGAVKQHRARLDPRNVLPKSFW